METFDTDRAPYGKLRYPESLLVTIPRVIEDITEERIRQEEKFPNQHLPLGTGGWSIEVVVWRNYCDEAAAQGRLTWRHILLEEFYEALAEEDPAKCRAELVQLAAVCVRTIEDIDRGTG